MQDRAKFGDELSDRDVALELVNRLHEKGNALNNLLVHRDTSDPEITQLIDSIVESMDGDVSTLEVLGDEFDETTHAEIQEVLDNFAPLREFQRITVPNVSNFLASIETVKFHFESES